MQVEVLSSMGYSYRFRINLAITDCQLTSYVSMSGDYLLVARKLLVVD